MPLGLCTSPLHLGGLSSTLRARLRHGRLWGCGSDSTQVLPAPLVAKSSGSGVTPGSLNPRSGAYAGVRHAVPQFPQLSNGANGSVRLTALSRGLEELARGHRNAGYVVTPQGTGAPSAPAAVMMPRPGCWPSQRALLTWATRNYQPGFVGTGFHPAQSCGHQRTPRPCGKGKLSSPSGKGRPAALDSQPHTAIPRTPAQDSAW